MGVAEPVLREALTNQPVRREAGSRLRLDDPVTGLGAARGGCGPGGDSGRVPATDRVGERRRFPPGGARTCYLFSHAASPRPPAGGSLRRPPQA
jgi:hypothetical protein